MDKVVHVAAALGPQPLLDAALGALAAAFGPESVEPNPKYILILLKTVEIEGLFWPQRSAP